MGRRSLRAPVVLGLLWCAAAAAIVLLVHLGRDSLEATSAPGVAGFTAVMTAAASGLAAVTVLRLALGLTAAVLEIRARSRPGWTGTDGARGRRSRRITHLLVTPALRRLALVLLGGSLSVLISVPAQASSAAVAGDRPAASTSAPALSATTPTAGTPTAGTTTASTPTAGTTTIASTAATPTGGPGAWTAGGDMTPATQRWTPDRPARPAVRSTQPDTSIVTPAPRPGTSVSDEVAVRAGDTLWAIAARHLGPDASAVDIAQAWPRWFDANRAVIGEDPDLLLPGQLLTPPDGLR